MNPSDPLVPRTAGQALRSSTPGGPDPGQVHQATSGGGPGPKALSDAQQAVLNAAAQGAMQAATQQASAVSTRRPEAPQHLDAGSSRFEPSTEALLQAMEAEPQVEISPELEKFVSKVERREIAPPPEVVVTDKQPDAVPPTAAQPVVILPASAQAMKKGRGTSVDTSLRWLVSWCDRQIHKFRDILVLYRDKR